MTCLYYQDITYFVTLFPYLDDFINYRLQGVVFGGAITRQKNLYPIRHIHFSCSKLNFFFPVNQTGVLRFRKLALLFRKKKATFPQIYTLRFR